MISINPFTRETIQEYKDLSQELLIQSIHCLHEGFQFWKNKSLSERCELNARLSDILLESKQELAVLITNEMGKPIRESIAEIEKCALLCRHYSNPGAINIDPIDIPTEAKNSCVRFEPLGIIFAIMPWNFPFWQVFRFAIPSLTVGNTIILKHAPNVSGCALAIEGIFRELDLGFTIFSSALIPAERSEEIISHSLVKGVSLTGSERAGRQVAALAGKHLKKVVLELGGSDPYIIFEDADLLPACSMAVRSRMLNAGQVCIAAKRFFVQKSIFQEFIHSFILETKKLKIGDPMLSDTDIGPLSRPDLLDEIERKVDESVKMGARILTGGHRSTEFPDFYLPTILTDINVNMPVFNEESFGPVAIVMPFETEEEVISLANNTRFGLGASVWTSDINKAKRISDQIESGCVFINSMVKSDPRLPFGGTKNSGFGRELTTFGALEFMNIKTEWTER
jgi:succinate-semialdehyde dehydrogenase/glutarate-semialdehyde dehydrogenase